MDLRELFDGLAAGIVVHVRHELEPHAQRLLTALGAEWVIDADADPCVRYCGRPECVSGVTRRRLAELIDAETRRRRLPQTRERVERSMGLEPSRERPMPTRKASNHRPSSRAYFRKCRTEGCEHPANTSYGRGVFAGLCEEVCMPRRRAEISQASKDRWAERNSTVTKEETVSSILEETPPLVPEAEGHRRDVESLLYLVEGFNSGTLSVYEDSPHGDSRRNDDIRDAVSRLAAKALSDYDSSIVGDVVKERLLNGLG